MNTGLRTGLILGALAACAIALFAVLTTQDGQGPMGWLDDFTQAPSAPKADRLAAPKSAEPERQPPAPSHPTPSAPPSAEAHAAVPPAPSNATGKPPADGTRGAFDIVRVEPSGDSVIAGRCSPGCTVELLANGRTHDRVVANAEGSWSMVPPQLAPGDYVLSLRVRTHDGQVSTSEQTVTVSVPKPPSKEVVVVLNAPGQASRILAMPTPDEKPAAPRPLTLGAVDAEGGRFFVQGSAPPGAMLRIYLNGSFIAAPVASADGAWSLRVEQGLSPGEYDLRVDQVENDAGRVISRALAKFAYRPEVAVASSDSRLPSAGGPAPASAADAVVPALDAVTVKRGDSLWSISRRSYGNGLRYTVIFAANDGQIRNPNLIYPGQTFVMPTRPSPN